MIDLSQSSKLYAYCMHMYLYTYVCIDVCKHLMGAIFAGSHPLTTFSRKRLLTDCHHLPLILINRHQHQRWYPNCVTTVPNIVPEKPGRTPAINPYLTIQVANSNPHWPPWNPIELTSINQSFTNNSTIIHHPSRQHFNHSKHQLLYPTVAPGPTVVRSKVPCRCRRPGD